MKNLKFIKLDNVLDATVWTVEDNGIVYYFNSYTDDESTKHFITSHIEELELFVKYDNLVSFNSTTKNGELMRKIWCDIDDLFCENDIDIFGCRDAISEQ